MRDQFAYTNLTGHQYYPSYFNVTIDGDEAVITVRGPETSSEGRRVCGKTCSPGKHGCNNYCRHWPLGYVPVEPEVMTLHHCGHSVSMRMPLAEFTALIEAFQRG